MMKAKSAKVYKYKTETIFELSESDWVMAGVPLPTHAEFFAVLENLQDLYDTRWTVDFKRAVKSAKGIDQEEPEEEA